MPPLCRFQLLPRPCVFTVFDFIQVPVPLVCIQLMGLSYVGSCAGPALCHASSQHSCIVGGSRYRNGHEHGNGYGWLDTGVRASQNSISRGTQVRPRP
eukprot:1141021-Pelagomonas_calceolata.AAC.1